MTVENHPFGVFMPRRPRAMIIGSFPIAKFTDPSRRSEIKPSELDFFFGGEKNLLWKLVSQALGRPIGDKQRLIQLLEDEGLAIGDLIQSCRRQGGGSSDSDLKEICWNRDLLAIIRRNGIKKVLFTSRGVERWFKRLFPDTPDLQKINLYSPSAQSARSLVRVAEFREWKKKHPQGKAFDFLLEAYRKVFSTLRTDS